MHTLLPLTRRGPWRVRGFGRTLGGPNAPRIAGSGPWGGVGSLPRGVAGQQVGWLVAQKRLESPLHNELFMLRQLGCDTGLCF